MPRTFSHDRLGEILHELHRMSRKVDRLRFHFRERIMNMTQEMQALTDAVAAETTIVDSAITLIQGIAARLTAAGTDKVQLTKLATDIKTESDSLAAAVAANVEVPPVAP